jgi:ankyrin repeat protein
MKNTLRTISFLFLCFAVFALPLCGQSRGDLTRNLRRAIEDRKTDAAASLLEGGANPNGFYDSGKKETFLMKTVSSTWDITEITKLLLDYGADPSARDSEGNSVAHYVYNSNSEEILKLLAAKGARFDIANNRGVSPLMSHVNNERRTGGVAFLMEWEEANSPGFTGGFPDRKAYCTAIFAGILNYLRGDETGIFSLVEHLLKAGVDPNGIVYDTHYDRGRETPSTFFILAIKREYNSVAGLLLDYGADMEARDGHERTAAFYCNPEGAALLASRGIRFDVTDKEGTSPLMWLNNSQYQKALLVLEWEEQHSPHFSARYGNRKDYLTRILVKFMNDNSLGDAHVQTATALIEKLIDDGADITAYRYFSSLAIGREQFIIPSLIERGVPISAFTQYGETILYNAVDKRNGELVTYLLGKGVDPNEQGKTGKTALMADSNARITSLLLEVGADINLVDENGGTALMHAKRRDTALLLLNAGADPTVKNLKGRTVLHYWGWSLSKMPLDEVLALGCFIDEPDRNGITPLMDAVRDAVRYDKYAKPTIAILLEKGADPNLRDPQGRNALHRYLAEVEGRARETLGGKIYDFEAITEMLLAAGARPSDTDDEGETALLVALRLSKRYERMASLGNIMLQYADSREAKIARSGASKKVNQEKRENTRYWMGVNLPTVAVALSVPLFVGGLSIGMREGVYRNDYARNFMGPVNGVLSFTMAGMAMGLILFNASDSGGGNNLMDFSGLFGVLSVLMGGSVGLFTGLIFAALVPSIGRAYNDNPVLYYLPTAISAITTSIIILKVNY